MMSQAPGRSTARALPRVSTLTLGEGLQGDKQRLRSVPILLRFPLLHDLAPLLESRENDPFERGALGRLGASDFHAARATAGLA